MLSRLRSKAWVMVVLLGLSSSLLDADEGLSITYQPPIVPVEFSFSQKGIDVQATKRIITPLGSFSLGYGLYELKDRSDYEDDYTYVVIEDMNERKEHIYKVNDGKRLTLASEGRTNVEVTKNRVRILVEKGSNFKVSFDVEGESRSYDSDDKWITPSDSVCRSHGGEVESNGCKAHWEDAKSICRAMDGRLPTIEELRKVVTDCGGEMTDDWSRDSDRNKANSSYQTCYKQKGFSSNYYWSSTTDASRTGFAWDVYFNYGDDYWNVKSDSYYVRCVRDGQ